MEGAVSEDELDFDENDYGDELLGKDEDFEEEKEE